MEIKAKEILIIFISLIGAILLAIISQNKVVDFSNLSFNDFIILFLITISSLIFIVYKRIGEVDNNVDNVKNKYNKLNERLKFYINLTRLEARIIALENKENDK